MQQCHRSPVERMRLQRWHSKASSFWSASGRVTRWIETAEEMCCPLDPLTATSGNTSQAVRTVYCTVIPVIQ